tara:strand:- start:8143 stop:8949 length:807 start_codon:yes stop_codon:yes gene_type:complete
MVEEALLPRVDKPISLSVFEGPLDLLLYLIRKHEIDVYDIPIETVTQQYLDILYAQEQMDLEVAGEFFVMAATLMVIKSRMLLPKDEQAVQEEEEEEEDGTDPRWELVQQLLEYQKLKEATDELAHLIESRQGYLARNFREKDTVVKRPLKNTDKMALWDTFNKILYRLSEKIVVGQIHDEEVTISDRMQHTLERLKEEPEFLFSTLIPESPSLNMIVASFLAVLELSRLKEIYLEQDDLFEDIRCRRFSVEEYEALSGEEDQDNEQQ